MASKNDRMGNMVSQMMGSPKRIETAPIEAQVLNASATLKKPSTKAKYCTSIDKQLLANIRQMSADTKLSVSAIIEIACTKTISDYKEKGIASVL